MQSWKPNFTTFSQFSRRPRVETRKSDSMVKYYKSTRTRPLAHRPRTDAELPGLEKVENLDCDKVS